jgi:hypothetical protein
MGIITHSEEDHTNGCTERCTSEPEFKTFPKIPRLRNSLCTITEKIDGTNAQIVIPEDPDGKWYVGSRNRWITPGKSTDNYGFAAWVEEHKAELRQLGVGRHYGEWYGLGIGPRQYGLTDRRFVLFNHRRPVESLPACVQVVPVLYTGPMDPEATHAAIECLKTFGSKLVPGFMDPEGIVLEYGANKFKFTYGGDGHKEGARNPMDLPPECA